MSVDQLSLFSTPAAAAPAEPQKSAIDRARSGEVINIMDLIEERKEKPAAPAPYEVTAICLNSGRFGLQKSNGEIIETFPVFFNLVDYCNDLKHIMTLTNPDAFPPAPVEDAKTAAATLTPAAAAAAPAKEYKTLADYLPDPQYNFKSGRMYSGENLWILDEAQKENNFSSPMWLGFYQARDLGGHVKKGSKGTCIKVFKQYQKQDQENPDKKENRQFFKNEYVFNIDQIEFKEDPTPPELEALTDQIRPRGEKKENKAPATQKTNAITTAAPAAAKPSNDQKLIDQLTNKLRRQIPGLEKFIKTEREKLDKKPTHTRRMMAQYESKLYTVNVKELYLNVFTNLLSRGITADDVKMYDLLDKHSYYIVGIRFNSDRWREYVNNKPYAFPHNCSNETKKEIESVYNWIESNLKIDPAKIKADKLDKAIRDAKNLHGVIDGFHSTPDALADRMIEKIDILHDYKILEPSAGIGALADKVRKYIEQNNIKNTQIDVCERSYELREILKLKDYNIICEDFTKMPALQNYDLIVMNPPFENDQDVEHIQHAFSMLKEGGQLIAIMKNSNMTKDNKKCREFREFLAANPYYNIDQMDPGAFKESRTMVATQMLYIEKR